MLTSRGFVKVKPTLQLPAFSNIFAAGDIIEWKEQKQAAKAMNHGKLVTANILSYLTGGQLKKYSTGPEMIIVTNGKVCLTHGLSFLPRFADFLIGAKGGGLAYMDLLWGITLGPWFARMIKSKTLLIPMLRKDSGL